MLADGFNFLELLGTCTLIVLAFFLLIAGFVAYHVWRLKRAMRKMGQAMEQAVQQMQTTGRPDFIDIQATSVEADGDRSGSKDPGASDPPRPHPPLLDEPRDRHSDKDDGWRS